VCPFNYTPAPITKQHELLSVLPELFLVLRNGGREYPHWVRICDSAPVKFSDAVKEIPHKGEIEMGFQHRRQILVLRAQELEFQNTVPQDAIGLTVAPDGTSETLQMQAHCSMAGIGNGILIRELLHVSGIPARVVKTVFNVL